MGVFPGKALQCLDVKDRGWVHACCLRHSHSLRRVSHPPGQIRDEGQGVRPSACSATEETEACGTLQIAMFCVRTRGRVSYVPRKIAAIPVLMNMRAICQVSSFARSYWSPKI